MKSLIQFFCLFALVALLAAAPLSTTFAAGPMDLPEGFTELNIGDAAPEFSLPRVDGKNYSLEEQRQRPNRTAFETVLSPVA